MLLSDCVNTLSASEDRYFKPSSHAFHRVSGRGKDAWLIRPGSYFLLPYKQAFGREFPRDFTIFLTLRPMEESEVSGRSMGEIRRWATGFGRPTFLAKYGLGNMG